MPDQADLIRAPHSQQQLADVLREGGLVIAARGRVRAARAPQVGRDHGVMPGERGHYLPPHVPGLRVAVQEDHGRSRAPHGVIEGDPVRPGRLLGKPVRDLRCAELCHCLLLFDRSVQIADMRRRPVSSAGWYLPQRPVSGGASRPAGPWPVPGSEVPGHASARPEPSAERSSAPR